MRRGRILFLADTHLGFDYPLRPRVERRRRGPDFFEMYNAALHFAQRNHVHAVVHGGDVFHRSKVPDTVLHRAFEPLVTIADAGIPVYIVPGNHERSVIPSSLFALHERIHIFESPATMVAELGELRVSISGFPCIRNGVDTRYEQTVRTLQIDFPVPEIDARILCMHQTVEGACVGTSDFMFQPGPDVISRRLIFEQNGGKFDVILSGHIHRHQILSPVDSLSVDLSAAEVDSVSGGPEESRHVRIQTGSVIYPGATERTSFDERDEKKGAVLVDFEINDGRLTISYTFLSLPVRPMVSISIAGENAIRNGWENAVRKALAPLDPGSIVRIRITPPLTMDVPTGIGEKMIREIAPDTMNVSLSIPNRWSHGKNRKS